MLLRLVQRRTKRTVVCIQLLLSSGHKLLGGGKEEGVFPHISENLLQLRQCGRLLRQEGSCRIQLSLESVHGIDQGLYGSRSFLSGQGRHGHRKGKHGLLKLPDPFVQRPDGLFRSCH
ncbi:hypothetical protein D3C75_619720 [compost metagenome]